MNFQLGSWGAAESFYHSWGHQPFQFWILQGLFLIWVLARRKSIRDWKWFAAFTLTSALDAWLTSDTVIGVGRLSAFWAQWLGIAFVIIGDLRLFWFLQPGKPLVAVVLAFVTPIANALMRAVPGFPVSNMRAVYFSYELTFVVFLGALLLGGSSFRSLKEFSSARMRRLSMIAFGYYAVWIAADALLLSGATGGLAEFAWSLRLLANLLYYGGLLPWIALAR